MSAFGGFGSTQPQQQQGTTGGLFGGGAFGATATGSNAGGSLFGGSNNTAQPAANTGGGLFGAANTNTNTQQGGGLFGSTQQQGGGGLFGGANTNTNTQQQGGGLFGNNQQGGSNAPSGGLFGNTQQQGQTGNTSGGLFGSTNASTNTGGGGLFGSTTGNTTGGGLFGNASNTNTGGGLFGNTSNTNTNQSAPSGGLFGSTTSAPNTTGGGLFGNAGNTTGTSGGLFGSTTGQTNTNTGGGLFGSNTTGQTGGLFGSTQPGTSTGQPSLFGGANQAQGSSLFGNTQQQQQQQQNQPGSLFGNIGQQQQQQQRPGGLFGSTLGGSTLGASNIGGNALVGSTNNLFASRPSTVVNPQQDAQTQFAQLTQRIEGIAQAWNSNSPQCRFQHYFYNLVDPNQVHLYGRPPNAFSDALWQKAVRENPDPSCFVPVIATGFDDLQKRVEAQTQQAAAHQEKLKELQQRIAALTQRHQLSNASRLQRASALQTQLTHRVIKLVQHLHLLIPALRSSALRPEEEALRTVLEEIDDEVRRPGGTGRIRGKLNELWALVGAVSAARERDRKASGVEWTVVDEDGLAQIAQILADEQAGLAHLTKLLQKDMKDLAIIQGSSPQDEDGDLGVSTATLRASTL
ncbi:nucleoporin complex subunit 54-domain-containing protein [Trametes elegans]|nr:nucleoporin complex subunit 54-domain-containing protein [Trametes elegans]